MPELHLEHDLSVDPLWSERNLLLWWARVNHRYHRKRQIFFEVFEQVTQAVSILAGVAIFSGKTLNDYAPLTGSVIVVISVFALAFGYSGRKMLHHDLSVKAGNLAAEIELCEIQPPTVQLLDKWRRVRIEITHTEPEPKATLIEFCEWQVASEDGYPGSRDKPNFVRRLFMNLF